MRRTALPLLAALILVPGAPSAPASDAPLPAAVALPAPRTAGGKPLMQALALRSTSRAFAPAPLPAQALSDLLWAAWGINRPKEGKRTAPSARNWQEIDVYVITAQGAFLYDAAGNRLEPRAGGDLRALGGTQEFVKDAPVTLVLVADAARMKGSSWAEGERWSWADAGFVGENVYLYCASEGLATGVRAFVDRDKLGPALGLRGDQHILLAQSVGYPKKE